MRNWLEGAIVARPEIAISLALGLGFVIGKLKIKIKGIVPGPVTGTLLAGAPTQSAVPDAAKSQVPVLGYTVPYAIGNVLLTIWGAVIVAVLA